MPANDMHELIDHEGNRSRKAPCGGLSPVQWLALNGVLSWIVVIVLIGIVAKDRTDLRDTRTTLSAVEKMVDVFAFRVLPGGDLLAEITSLVEREQLSAAWISTCVGGLNRTSIRYAWAPNATQLTGHFEITSLVGLLSTNGSHVHIGVADENGVGIGGHLMPGASVYPTAELVIFGTRKYRFERAYDGTTPWKELQIIEL